MVFWEDRLSAVSDEIIVTTDDGSYGRSGVSAATLPFGVPTVVSLNPIMVDGTGMCGVCRVTVGGATKFTCVDGPDFDAHKVDWNELMARQRTYVEEEKLSLDKWQRDAARR